MFMHSDSKKCGAKNFPTYKNFQGSNSTFQSSIAFQMGVLDKLYKSNFQTTTKMAPCKMED